MFQALALCRSELLIFISYNVIIYVNKQSIQNKNHSKYRMKHLKIQKLCR